jgi:ankyrin repeat protein
MLLGYVFPKDKSDNYESMYKTLHKVKSDEKMMELAAANGYDSIVKLLVEQGQSVDILVKTLKIATKAGHLTIVRYLVDILEKSPGAIGGLILQNILLHDVSGDNLDVFEYLNSKIDNPSTAYIHMLLRDSIIKGHVHILQYLVDTYNLDTHQILMGSLRLPATYGHLDALQYLVDTHNFDIHQDHELALRSAVKYGHLDIVEYLVGMGADLHVMVDELLGEAVSSGNLYVVEYLLKAGANINAGGGNAMQVAVSNKNEEMVRYLIKSGANPCLGDPWADIKKHTKMYDLYNELKIYNLC